MSEFQTTSLCFSTHRHLKSETYSTLVQILSHCYDHSQICPQDQSIEMCGRAEFVQENGISFPNTSMDQNGVNALMNGGQEHVRVQQILNAEHRSMIELHVGKGESNLDVPKSFDSSVNRNMNSQVSRLVEDSEVRNSKLRTNVLEVENEIQQKEIEVEDLVHKNGTIDAHDYGTEDMEVEEGEISGGFEYDEESVDMMSDDAVVSNEKEDEKQVSKGVTDMRGLSCNEKSRGIEIFSESTSFNFNAADDSISGRAVELKEAVSNETQCNSKSLAGKNATLTIDVDKNNSMPAAGRNKGKDNRDKEGIGSFSMLCGGSTAYKDIIKEKVTQKQGNASQEKPDSVVCNKKKRSSLSKESKAKKKQKKRKKRAEKNQKLGVRRLKLPLNVKPKTVNYCHHYLRGRCQEGDKCKFSHDAVPLTKSTKACCHFARNSCMKGDNCPFDHELSKYPCDNFVAKRFCNRGDECLFSHKIPPKEEGPPASSTCTPEQKPLPLPLLQSPNYVDRISHQNVDAFSNHGKVSSFKKIEQTVAKNVPKPPAVAPKGISLFLGKSSVLESSKLNQGSSSPKRCDSGKFTNQTEQIASVSVQNGDETPRRISMASKGVNFLSFGNVPLENSNGKKLGCLFLNRDNGFKSSPLNKFSLHENTSSFHNGEKSAEVGNARTQRFLSSVEKSNDTMKQTQPEITPQGLNFLSTGKGLANNNVSDKQSSLHSSVGVATNRSLQESQNAPDIPQTSRAIPWRLSGSSLASGHRFNHSEQGYYSSTSNTAQKALAFATKIEPKVKTNQSAVGGWVDTAKKG